MSEPAIENSAARRQRWRRHGVWLAIYFVWLTAIILGMFAARRTAFTTFDTPEARAQWDAWREAPPNQPQNRTELPVKRKPPSTAEPPALVLMRDHFTVMLCGAMLFGSLLFAALMLAARGALAGSKQETPGGKP